METSKRKFNERQSEHTNPENRYEIAYIRVKRIKGFYVHLMVYVFVNAVIICSNYYGNSHEDSFSWSLQTFSNSDKKIMFIRPSCNKMSCVNTELP